MSVNIVVKRDWMKVTHTTMLSRCYIHTRIHDLLFFFFISSEPISNEQLLEECKAASLKKTVSGFREN